MEVAGPLGTPLGLAQRKRASPRGEAGTSAQADDMPMYCGEHGVIDLAPKEDALRWIRDIHAVFHKYGIGSALWNYKGLDYGISDAANVVIKNGYAGCDRRGGKRAMLCADHWPWVRGGVQITFHTFFLRTMNYNSQTKET